MAQETLRIVGEGEYVTSGGETVRLGEHVREAIDRTWLTRPDELSRLARRAPAAGDVALRIEVTGETTVQAARRLVVDEGAEDVMCLNFASAKNAGGGFLGGSQAQEESLARSSALYACLQAVPDYYAINRACGTAFYTDHMIVSPDVPVFRDDEGELLEAPYRVSMLTAPAVNAGAVAKNEPHRRAEVRAVMRRRIGMLFALAAEERFRHLILGAWGCGVFRNDPQEIAELFAEQLLAGGVYARSFDRVIFAVLDRPGGPTMGAFVEVFADVAEGVQR